MEPVNYRRLAIECYEAGKGLWHARLWRADRNPMIVGGVPFSTIEIGFAWPDPESAAADAKNQIDRLKLTAIRSDRHLAQELSAA